MLAKELHALRDLGVADLVGSGQNDRAGIFNLVDKKLAEVLDIDLALGSIYNCDCTVQFHLGTFCRILDGLHDVRELADAGGLDENSLRRIGAHHFTQRCTKISHQRAADAAGIHFTDFNAGFFEESAVNADLAEFILDQDDTGARECILKQFFDQGCLSGSKKTGNNINFRHSIASFP